jgi:hypothetical protein
MSHNVLIRSSKSLEHHGARKGRETHERREQQKSIRSQHLLPLCPQKQRSQAAQSFIIDSIFRYSIPPPKKQIPSNLPNMQIKTFTIAAVSMLASLAQAGILARTTCTAGVVYCGYQLDGFGWLPFSSTMPKFPSSCRADTIMNSGTV